MTLDEWKKSLEEKRKITLAKIEKEKSILNRVDLWLTDPDRYFKGVLKSKKKYEKKKSRPPVEHRPDLGEQIARVAEEIKTDAPKKKHFLDIDL